MSLGIDIFIGLLAAHVIGDFVLQSRRDVARKHRGSVMIRHVAVHGILTYFFVGAWGAIWLPVVVAASHGVIDWYKTQFGEPTLRWFATDQLAHLLVLAVFAGVAGATGVVPAWSSPDAALVFPLMLVIAGAIVAIRVGSMVLNLALAPYLANMRDRLGDEAMPDTRGFQRGGQTIGYLERALIFVFVLAGHPGAVGFLVAAKAFLRFGEIRSHDNRLEAEYIIIGTLASFAFGTIVSYCVVALLALH
jgi:hypothetical protein